MRILRQLYFLIGISLLISCEKDLEAGKITFTDIQPNKSLTTYGISTSKFFENNIKVAISKPWVNDSLFTFAISNTPLDLNKDGIEDFAIKIVQELADPSQYIYNSKYVIQLNSLNSNTISMANSDLRQMKKYDFGENMDPTTFCDGGSNSKNDIGGFMVNIEGDDNFQLLGDYYVAVKIMLDSKSYFGWLHVKVDFFKLQLCDYAISNVPNTLIKIGQIK